MQMKKVATVAFLLFSAHLLTGQTLTRTEDTLKPKDIVIVKEYEPTISDADKINKSPRVVDTLEVSQEPLDYSVIPKQIHTSFEVSPIKPAVMKGEPLDKLYKAYVKGGYGLYNTTLGELYINNLRSRTKNYGFKANHLSSTGNIKDVGHSGYINTNADLFGKQIYYNKILSGGVGYDIDRFHKYGFNPNELDTALFPETYAEDSLGKEQIRQQYQKLRGNVQFKSYYKDSNLINFDTRLSAYNLQDNQGKQENNMTFTATLDRFYDDKHVFLETDVNYNNYTDGNTVYNNTLVKLQPEVVLGGDKWRLKVGLGIYADADSITTFHFYPIAFAKYNVIGNLIIPYAGIKGGLYRYGYDQLRQQNPFLVNNPTLAVSNERYDLFGGIRGEFSSTTSFNLKASSRRIDNMPLFINDYSDNIGNEFFVQYDTAEVTTFTGEITFQKTDKINVYARGDYYLYRIRQEARAWHYPAMRATLSAVYDLRDKLVFRGDIFYISSQFARVLDPTQGAPVGFGFFEKQIQGTVDVNLGVEYRYNQNISGWLNLNNIASINYQRWNQYPSQGIVVMAGFTYSLFAR